jgi:hypothetical protein
MPWNISALDCAQIFLFRFGHRAVCRARRESKKLTADYTDHTDGRKRSAFPDQLNSSDLFHQPSTKSAASLPSSVSSASSAVNSDVPETLKTRVTIATRA